MRPGGVQIRRVRRDPKRLLAQLKKIQKHGHDLRSPAAQVYIALAAPMSGSTMLSCRTTAFGVSVRLARVREPMYASSRNFGVHLPADRYCTSDCLSLQCSGHYLRMYALPGAASTSESLKERS